MRKKNSVIIAALFIVFAAHSLSFAQNINYSAPNKIALGEDILKEVIKRTIYEVGNKVIEKYGPGSDFLNNLNKNNNNNANSATSNYSNNTTTNTSSGSSTTGETSTSTNQNTNTDNQIQEQLIPVS